MRDQLGEAWQSGSRTVRTDGRCCVLAVGAGLAWSLASAADAQSLVGYPGYTIQRIGLFGPGQTDSGGLQSSTASFLAASGQVAGYSNRYSSAGVDGQDAWVWNGFGTLQVGLIGGVHTGAGGQQFNQPLFQNDAGQLSGYSSRYVGLSNPNGQDSWAWNGATTLQIGLTGGAYSGTSSYQFSLPQFQNAAGHVAGFSSRITGQSTDNGRDCWVWTGASTVEIGLTGVGYSGSAGYRYSQVQSQNDAGMIIGYSGRYTGVNTSNGADAWAWNGSTNTQIGLTGGAYVGTAGYQVSQPTFLNAAGQVAGFSQRINGASFDNGRDTWVWNGSSTVQIGLSGSAYTGSAGYQYSQPLAQNQAGQVIGSTQRITGVNVNNGINVWAWNGTSTVQLGFTGPGYVGSAGYQVSEVDSQNNSGQVIGASDRFSGVATPGGRDTWIWNGASTTQTGLTGAAYLGSAGYRSSTNISQNTAGQVVGFTTRYLGMNTPNGHDAWVWNGTTSSQIGLTGGAYTGSSGYQFSQPVLQNESGQIAGYAARVTGASNPNGQDAWYFDPSTGQSSALVGSVRTSDLYQFSEPTLLTANGYLLGDYTFFQGGVGAGELRAFVFRPDLGMTDLGALVDGGLSASGWSTLQRPQLSLLLDEIVGYGLVTGQVNGQSAFVMIPAPCSGIVLGMCGLLGTRRRRRSESL